MKRMKSISVIHLVFWQQIVTFVIVGPFAVIIICWILERIWLTIIPIIATIIAMIRMKNQGDIHGLLQMGKDLQDSVDYVTERKEKGEEPDIEDPYIPRFIKNMHEDFEKDVIYRSLDWCATPLNIAIEYAREVMYDWKHPEDDDKGEE